jgi:Domain of unknown function (DUF1772)
MKTACPFPYQADTIAAIVATGLAGLVAGSLSFGSFVDVRTLLHLVRDDDNDDDDDETVNAETKQKNIDTVAHLFPVLWPFGRDWMVPLMAVTSVAHFGTYYFCCSSKTTTTSCCGGNSKNHHMSSSSSSSLSWLYSGLAILSILPYTKLIMGQDIEKLMYNNKYHNNDTDNTTRLSTTELVARTRSFGKKHHVRTVVALAAFGLSLVSLVHLPSGSGGSGSAAAKK